LEPQILLIPIAVEALVEENFLSLILRSNTDQLLVHPDNFFVIILLINLRADVVFIVEDYVTANSIPNHHSISDVG
jgi:hypothetical protein